MSENQNEEQQKPKTEKKKVSMEEMMAILQKKAQLPATLNSTSSKKDSKDPNANKQKPPRYIMMIQSFITSCISYTDRLMNYVIKKPEVHEDKDVMESARYPIMFGYQIIFWFVIVGGAWMFLAPLDSAAPARGVVTPNMHKQMIQPGIQGVVKEIKVKEGDQVKRNDPLIVLDETSYKAAFENAEHKYFLYLTMYDRLVAERDSLNEINFSSELKQRSADKTIFKMMEIQKNLFDGRNEVKHNTFEAINSQITQYKELVETYKIESEASERNLAIVKERLDGAKTLHTKGHVSRAQLEQIEAQYNQAKTAHSRAKSQYINSQQEILKLENEKIAKESDYLNKVIQELTNVQDQLNSVKAEYIRIKDGLDKTIIRSPVDGIINDIQVHTIGATVGPNMHVAEVTPTNDKLIILARIPVSYIDVVHVGLVAKIKFSSFKSRTTPTFHGTVVNVSPDTVMDRQTAMQMQNPMLAGDGHFYTAKIELDMEEFNEIAKKHKLKLQPGMNADVLIITGERTLFRYLMDPITDHAFKAFIEK